MHFPSRAPASAHFKFWWRKTGGFRYTDLKSPLDIAYCFLPTAYCVTP